MTRPKPIEHDSPLLDWRSPALAREGDPVTSHESGEATSKGAARSAQCAELFTAIAAEPGLIAVVYLERTGLEKGGWKRVSDLVNRGSVHWYGAALNPATNRKCGCLRLGPDPIGRVRSIADKVDGPTLRRVLGDPIAMGYEKLGGEDPFK